MYPDGGPTTLDSLGLDRNHLSGQIPEELFKIEALHALSLEENHLSGQIPEGIGSHALQAVSLRGNRLTGAIPESILDLDFLSRIDVQWNALYSTSAEVEQFLNARGGSGFFSQTLAPDQLAAVAAGPTSVRLDWTPTSSDPDVLNKPGGYLVYAKTGSGALRLIKTVAGKQISTVTLTGLAPGTTYTFSLRTFTRPHADNKNTVRSGLAQPVTVTTRLTGRAGRSIP